MKDFKKIRLVLNSVLPAVILYEWLNMFFFANGNLLSSRGLQSLKYFTILSNLLEAFACLWWLFRKDEVLKFMASVAVMLTCIVVLVFLGPMFGYRAMFAGPNLWFHLLVPLTALAEVLFLVNRTYSKKEIFLASLTMAVYGIFYLGNILINGIGQRHASNDWYGFLNWGYMAGALIFLFIVITNWITAFSLRLIRNRTTRS